MTSSATKRRPKHRGQDLGRVSKGKPSESHDGWNVPECIPLEPSAGPLTVGRTSQADIFLHSPQHPSMLSRVHASLWFNKSTSQWTITDLESLNGVFVNGKRVKASTPVALENGTEICFGSWVPRNELRYSLVTSCGDPHLLLKLGARQEERETVVAPAAGDPKENTEPSPGLVKDTPTTSVASPREILYEQDSEQDLLPPAKKPRVEEDVSLPGTGLLSSSQSAKASCSSSDENDSQHNNTAKLPASNSRDTDIKRWIPDKELTTYSSQYKDNTASNTSQQIFQVPPPTVVPQHPPSTTTTPSYPVSPLSHLETPASAIDELFSDGAVEKYFDEIVSDAIFGEDGSVLPSSTVGPSSEAVAVGTAGSRGYLDGASLQIQAARDDMQKEKQKWLSSIEALKSELASKEKLLAQKSEQEEKEEEKRKKEGEGVIDSMQEEFTCVICQELFIEAHTLPCAHSFCKKCIREWMKSKRECPVCRKPMSADPVHSLVLDNAIDKMVEKMGPAAVEERKKLKDSRASAPRQFGGSGSGGNFGGSGGSSSGFGGSSSGSGGTQSGSGGSSSGSGGTQSGFSGHGSGSRGSSGSGNSGGRGGNRGGRSGGGNGSGGQSGVSRGGGGSRHHQHGGHRHRRYYESDNYDDDEEYDEEYDEEDDEEDDEVEDDDEEGSYGSDDSYDFGLDSAYYGGYGRCFNCGARGHWVNGCPY